VCVTCRSGLWAVEKLDWPVWRRMPSDPARRILERWLLCLHECQVRIIFNPFFFELCHVLSTHLFKQLRVARFVRARVMPSKMWSIEPVCMWRDNLSGWAEPIWFPPSWLWVSRLLHRGRRRFHQYRIRYQWAFWLFPGNSARECLQEKSRLLLKEVGRKLRCCLPRTRSRGVFRLFRWCFPVESGSLEESIGGWVRDIRHRSCAHYWDVAVNCPF